MKKLLIFTFSLLITSSFAQWVHQSPKPTNDCLLDIQFTNENTGWIVGDNGTILLTNDGGESWTNQVSNTTQNLRGTSFVNNNYGWIVGDSGTILHTMDGENWIDYSISDSLYLNSVVFIDEYNGWACGSAYNGSGIILKSANSGIDWEIHELFPNQGLNDICFTSLNSGWVVGWHGIFHTENGGISWELQYNSDWYNFSAVSFTDSLHGWAGGVGGKPELLKTTDGGENWILTSLYPMSNGEFSDIFFFNSMNGWVSSNGGEPSSTCRLAYTSDGGLNWGYCYNTDLVFSSQINAIYFSDYETGWTVGPSGNISNTIDGTNWNKQSMITNDKGITDIGFVDNKTGWAIGNTYYIFQHSSFLKTIDGGENWSIQNTFNDFVYHLFVIDENNIWVTGESSQYKTTDGGQNWEEIYDVEWNLCIDLFFTDIENGWAIDYDIDNPSYANIYKTTDAGNSWIKYYSETEYLRSIFFLDEDLGWAVGKTSDSGIVINTIDGGITWNNQLYIRYRNFSKVYFSDSNTGLVIDYHGSVFKTANGGEDWIQINEGFDVDISSVFIVDIDNIWVVGDRGQYPDPVFEGLIYYSNDGGVTWQEQVSGTTNELENIWFNNSEEGWIVGGGGTILYTENGGIVSVEEPSRPVQKLSQITPFPNPFFTSTTISFDLPQPSTVQITIFNHLGQQVDFIQQTQSQGKQQINWDASGQASGMYYFQLKAGEQVALGKIVKLK